MFPMHQNALLGLFRQRQFQPPPLNIQPPQQNPQQMYGSPFAANFMNALMQLQQKQSPRHQPGGSGFKQYGQEWQNGQADGLRASGMIHPVQQRYY
jgi:hypothetical protein